MEEFIRNDGVILKLHPEIRLDLHKRPSANPKGHWSDENYMAGAQVKLKRWRNRMSKLSALGVSLDGKRVLEVACGNGIDAILLALSPIKQVIGVDLHLPLTVHGEKGTRHRKLAVETLRAFGKDVDIWDCLCELPLSFVQANATNLAFDNNSFDLILSKSFLEHMIPIEAALAEMERVLAPGGLMYHVIDPYYWLRGCHAPGLVDIPWAHARLQPAEYNRFVTESEGEAVAKKRSQWQDSLNHCTPREYRKIFDKSGLEILSWKESRSEYAEEILSQLPDILHSVIDGVSSHDLVCSGISILARKR